MSADRSHTCISVERISDVFELVGSEPMRAELERCPRCRTLLHSYAAFLRAEDIPDAGLTAARSRLNATVEALANPHATGAPNPPAGGKASLSAWLRPARLIPVAAVVALAAAVLLQNRNPEIVTLRAPATDVAQAFSLLEPRVVEGGVELSWRAHAEADGYEVVVYGPALETVFRSTTRDTRLVIHRSDIPDAVLSGSAITWRVHALHTGDTIASTEPGSVTAP